MFTDSIKGSFIQYPMIYYDGFKIHKIRFEKILEKNNLIIGSRNGKNPLKYKEEIISMYEEKGLTLLIGPPEGMLLKKLGEKFLEKSYNFIIKQGVSDVRAEEAIISSLSLLNAILE
jgi:predicted SPOUT superfamily RNA methylase MTH1